MDVMTELNRKIIFYEVFGRTGDYLRSAKESMYYPSVEEMEEKGIVSLVDMDFVEGEPYMSTWKTMLYPEAQEYFSVYTDTPKVAFNSVIYYDGDVYYVHDDIITQYRREQEYRRLYEKNS